MILESLQKIKKAEAEVKERIENSKGEAIRIIEKAKTDAEKLLAEKIKSSQRKAEKMREDAVEEAKKEGLNIANKWTKETKGLSEEAQGNLEKAKEFILRSLLG
jgi:vacuolar-type H+-ATPase subunit H